MHTKIVTILVEELIVYKLSTLFSKRVWEEKCVGLLRVCLSNFKKYNFRSFDMRLFSVVDNLLG